MHIVSFIRFCHIGVKHVVPNLLILILVCHIVEATVFKFLFVRLFALIAQGADEALLNLFKHLVGLVFGKHHGVRSNQIVFWIHSGKVLLKVQSPLLEMEALVRRKPFD